MSELWKKLEGQTVDGQFPLREYLGGREDSAVFLTQLADGIDQAAIKLVREDSRHAELQLAHWRLAANITHPNLIRIFQTGRWQADGERLLYSVMEYADENLARVLRQRALTAKETQEMLLPALDALAFVHGKGCVHGRIKPANILAIDDRLKISSDSLHGAAEAGQLGGEGSSYDAPEVASVGYSAAGDVWSLGMTIVEVLTQHLPVWDRATQIEPPLPNALPAPFIEIAHRCLRRDPAARWTAAQIATRLRPTISPVAPQLIARTTQGRKVAAPIATPKPRIRSRNWTLAVVGVVVLVAIALGWRLHSRLDVASNAPVAVERASVPAKIDANPPVAGESAARSGSESPSVSPAPTPARSETEAAKAPSVEGAVARQVLPEVPQKASDTISGTVRVSVRVNVDAKGSVSDAQLDSPGPSKYFADLAERAARDWKFSPPLLNGGALPSEWLLRFRFTRGGATVSPSEEKP